MNNCIIDDEIHIGDWVYLGFTKRLYKVTGFSYDTNSSNKIDFYMENGNGIIYLVEAATGTYYDAERNRVRKIKDLSLIKQLNQLYPNLT